jgi:hypothetical protein
MTADVDSAERFVLTNARLLERQLCAVLLHGAAIDPVLAALRAYRNPDGGFGNALEPDVRAPQSEPVATLSALAILAEIGAPDDPMVAGAAAWLAAIAEADGGVPFVMATADSYPRAPWMVPSDGGSHLTFAFAALLAGSGLGEPWLARATQWCWRKLARPADLSAYWVKFALDFLDAAADHERATAALAGLGTRIEADGTVPVPGGTEDERLTPLDLSPRPGSATRALFSDEQIEADLDRLCHEQEGDGGWSFDWLAWSPGQALEWRGIVTVRALATLRANGRLRLDGES